MRGSIHVESAMCLGLDLKCVTHDCEAFHSRTVKNAKRDCSNESSCSTTHSYGLIPLLLHHSSPVHLLNFRAQSLEDLLHASKCKRWINMQTIEIVS